MQYCALLFRVRHLKSVPDAVLWIINSNGEIIVSTQKNIDVRDPIPLEEFDASKWGSNYYQIGKFYGFFKTDHLSVIAT